MKGKHDLAILCDRIGLRGSDRTDENMQQAVGEQAIYTIDAYGTGIADAAA